MWKLGVFGSSARRGRMIVIPSVRAASASSRPA
jgi:hypothetical protein